MLTLNACLIIIVFVATLFMTTWFEHRYNHYKFFSHIFSLYILTILYGGIFFSLCAIPEVAPYAAVSLISFLANIIFALIVKLEIHNVIHFTKSKTEKTIFLVMWGLFALVLIISFICGFVAFAVNITIA